MSAYTLQKAIRNINRRPEARAEFDSAPEAFVARYELSDEERAALLARDYGALYRLGVHGLLLRPFSLLRAVPEADYLAAIRRDA
jgi:Aromatic-ring-opening dioxygenase LigAB, LigA subunit